MADSNNSGTAAAAAAQGDLTQHPNEATHGNCDDDDCDNNDDYEDTVEEANNDDDPLVLSEQEAEFNDDNDGANNVEDDLSPTDLLFYRQCIQPLGGERIARGLVKPFLPQIFELICKNHRFFDINGNGKNGALPGIVLPKITTNGGVYVTVQKDKNADGLYTIMTVGSTSNFKKRLEYKIKVSKRILLSLLVL